MAEAGGEKAGGIVPNPRILKVMGILNIVFASGLILAGLCMGVVTAMQPYMNRAVADLQKKTEADLAKKQKADLEAIEKEEEAAATEEDKKVLQERRKAIEARPRTVTQVPSFDFNKLRMDQPRLIIYGWVDVGTALFLDVLMLASGIGMIGRRLWGLRLGIWTAVAKIARLLLLYSYFALAIVPAMAQTLGRLVGEMMARQPGAMGQPPPPGFDASAFTRIYYITYTAIAVGMIVIGSIYPAISLWLLTRPGARAACDESRMPPGQELNETW